MFQTGEYIDRYQIQRRIGRGGMGAVYAAQDPVLGRMVAIKVFEGDMEAVDARQRFAREARAAAALSHPGIVTIFDFGECNEQPYIVMEWVTGETLASIIRRRAEVSLADKVRWVEEICAAAAYAHRRSVVHRDLKPANLMLDGTGRLRILDFGIARMLGTASTTQTVAGTPGYMAPEQIEGSAVDHRADIFAVGVVLYELIAYRDAFPGETPVAITHRILTQEPQPLAEIIPGLDPALSEICRRALKKTVAERFQHADELRAALARVREDLGASETLHLGPPFGNSAPAPRLSDSGTAPHAATDAPSGEGARTPLPTPRRTDREALARRRAEWLTGAVEESRTKLAAGALEEALESCQRALAIDEAHPEALALEQQILTALEEAHGAPAAQPPSAVHATAADDGTVMIPLRQHGDPPSPPVHVAAALTEPSVAVAPQRLPSSLPPPTASGGKPAADRPPARQGGLPRQALAAVAAVGVLTVAGAALVMMPGGGPAPAGTLVLDAIPWALVASIESADGEQMPLPADAATPLTLQLPAGEYRVVLNGPPPSSLPQQLTVNVVEEGTSAPPAVRFPSLSVEEYFESYLTGAAPAPPDPGAFAP